MFNNSLLQTTQSEDFSGTLNKSQFNKLDGNVYVRNNKEDAIFSWTPASGNKGTVEIKNIEDLKKINNEFEVNGKLLDKENRSIFKSPELNNYKLVNPSIISGVGIPLEKEVWQLLKRSEEDILIPGSYQVEK